MRARLAFLAPLLAILVALLPAATFASPVPQDGGPNLLQDGDFEWSAPWDGQDGIGEVKPAPPWRAYWVSKPSKNIKRPYNCSGSDFGCYWAVPEFTDVQVIATKYRVHGGYQAQKYFTYGRMHEAGLMQRVEGIAPGAKLRFSVYMQAWMCFNFDKCDWGKLSDEPSDMHLRVGIDPTGGTDPFSANIVWSGEQPAWDEYVLFSVEAVAQGSAVTVFTHSRADWDWARTNNDVYIDDASLVVVGQAPVQPPTKTPAPQPQAQMQPAAQAQAQPAQPAAARATATPPPLATSTPAPTATSTPIPTETATPTETPVRRVIKLPPTETNTPGPFDGLTSALSGPGSGGGLGLVFLGGALFVAAILAGGMVARVRRPR